MHSQQEDAGNGIADVHFTTSFGNDIHTDHIPDNLKMFQSKLVQVSFKLWPAHIKYIGYGPRPARSVFHGITDEEVQDLCCRHSMSSNPGVAEPLTPNEELVVMFATETAFTVTCMWNEQYPESWSNFSRFWCTLFDLACSYGNFCWYSMQSPANNISSPEFLWELMAHPRWCFKQPRYDKTGTLTSATPTEWAEFRVPKKWPDMATQCASLALSVGRNSSTLLKVMQENLRSQQGSICIVFKKSTFCETHYIVRISASVLACPRSKEFARPDVGTRLSITWTPTRSTGRSYTVSGIVLPEVRDVVGSYAEVFVASRHKNLDQITIRNASVTLQDDPTSQDQQKIAIAHMSHGLLRRSGLDILERFYDAPSTVARASRNPWSKSLGAARRMKFNIATNAFNLTAEQIRIKDDFLSNSEGLTLVDGPSGTGKSLALAAVISAYISTNKEHRRAERYPVMLVAPSEATVDLLLSKISTHQIEVCRFKGTYVEADKPRKTVVDTSIQEKMRKMLLDGEGKTEEDALTNEYALFEMHNINYEDNGEDRFHGLLYQTRTEELIKRWANDICSEHDIHDIAVGYLQIRSRLGAPNSVRRWSETEFKDNWRKMRDAHKLLIDYYFCEVVDLVATTVESAAHDVLSASFPPSLLVLDEAALVSIVDLMRLMAAQKEHITHVVMAGNPQTARSLSLANVGNEYHSAIARSILAKLLNDPMKNQSVVNLRTQHRMHPEIARAVDKSACPGYRLVNAPNTQGSTSDWFTARRFLKETFGSAYRDWRMFGIDVSGPNVECEPSNTGNSPCNMAQAEAIVRFIASLLSRPAIGNGTKILARNILVITAYQGQQILITRMLDTAGLMQDKTNKPRVVTLGSAHGLESDIVLVSLCVNRPESLSALRVVAESHSLNLLISRDKHLEVFFGNILYWLRSSVRRNDSYKPNVFKSSGSNLKLFGDLFSSLCPAGGVPKIISRNDFEEGLYHGKPATVAEFSSLLE